jgi:hypothetical protein
MTRTFKLIRLQDLTGTSGTGVVAQGETQADGRTIMRWIVDAKLADGSKRRIQTTTHYETWQDVVLLHGHAGRTVLKWDDSGETVSDWDLLAVKSA